MPMTKSQAADVRRVLQLAGSVLPGDDETAAAGVLLDEHTAGLLELDPVLSRPWRRRAERYATDQLAAERDAADDTDDPSDPA